MNKIFSILLTLFVLISLIASVWVVSNQKFDIRKNAAEEKKTISISQWVPINISDIDQSVSKQIDNINSQKTYISKGSTQQKKLDSSLEIQNIIKKDISSMDTGQDEEVDYKEFNANIINLSNKIYNLRHIQDDTKIKGLYKTDDILSKNVNSKKILKIIVESGIYNELQSSLEVYESDIIRDNPDYQVMVYECNGCTKEEIKSKLKEGNTVGAILVGDLPTAWFYTEGCFGWPGYTEIFPTDLYYMDLNGVWGGEINGFLEKPFSVHSGNIKPEIFVARLTTPVESLEIDLLKMYFRKNHNFRSFRKNISNRSLNYIDNDWSSGASNWSEQVRLAYTSSTLVSGRSTTNGVDYKNRWKTEYEHLLVAVHSNYLSHYFDPYLENGDVSWVEVKDIKPKVNFYNLFACSNALYTMENYMAGWYIFQDSNYGLTAVGSTKTGGMLYFDIFYQSLSMENNFGTAFKDWFLNKNVYSDKCWFGGMVMIGDPTLKRTITCTAWQTGNWTTCKSNGVQTRTVTKIPLGCNSGTPANKPNTNRKCSTCSNSNCGNCATLSLCNANTGCNWSYNGNYCENKTQTNPPTVVKINGKCGNKRNSCNGGIYSDLPDSSLLYLWRCLGENGGVNVKCSSKKINYGYTE